MPLATRHLIKCVPASGQLGSPQAVGPLLELLTAQDSGVRQSAVEALGRLGSPQAVGPLLERLKDTDYDVRWMALLALGKIDSSRALDAAATIFVDTTGQREVKALAAVFLLLSEHQESLSFLRDLAGSEVVANRVQAAVALGAFSTDPGTALLMQLLRDDNRQVKFKAVASLGQIKAVIAISSLIHLCLWLSQRQMFICR